MISHIKYVISPKYSKHIINMLSNDNKRGHIHMSKVKSSQDQFDRIIREEECRRLTGICRTTRYMMERGVSSPSSVGGSFCRLVAV